MKHTTDKEVNALHTPGEWELDYTSKDGVTLWANDERDEGICLATIYTEAKEYEANAELIASAPRLKAENENLMAQLNTESDYQFLLKQENEKLVSDARVLREALGNFTQAIDIIVEGLEDGHRKQTYKSIKNSLTYKTATEALNQTK